MVSPWLLKLSIHTLCFNSEYGKIHSMKEQMKGENGYLLYFLDRPAELSALYVFSLLSSEKCVEVDISFPI